MKQSNFRPAHFTVPQNYVDKVQPKGVDVSSPQMEVDKDRGVYSINYMWNGNKASKRFGYRKVGYLPEDGEITAAWRINFGYAPIYVLALYTKRYSRTILYSAKMQGGRFVNFKTISGGEFGSRLTNDNGFVKGERLWIFGTGSGNGLLILTPVVDSNGFHVEKDASFSIYVPTTTISMIPNNVETMPNQGSASYEQPNIITPLRKNAFVGGLDSNPIISSGFISQVQSLLVLDSLINATNKYGLYDFRIRINGNGQGNFANTDANGNVTLREQRSSGFEAGSHALDGVLLRVKYTVEDESSYNWLIVRESDLGHWESNYNFDRLQNLLGNAEVSVSDIMTFNNLNNSSTEVVLEYDGHTRVINVIGEVGQLEYANGNVIALKNNWYGLSMIAGEANIIVQYPSVDASSLVFAGTKAALFGHNNALNRVWVYGGSKPNYAYVSAEATQDYEIDDEVHDSDEDFTYFPVDNFYKFGGEDSKIIGMKIISESKMMVLKEKSGSSPSMYFVSPVLVDSFVGQTNIVQERYQTAPSNTMTAGVDYPDSLANFNGDIVFFSSEHQIVGLDIEGITGDSRRAAYSRSKYIDRELKNESGCSLYSFANYLICRTASGNGYVAHRSQFNPNTRQYEWWPIDIPEGTSNFFEDNDGTLFIFAGCNVFQLEGHTDIDRYFINTESGNLGLANEEYIVTTDSIRNKVTSESGWLFEFGGNGAYAIVGTAEEIFDFVGLDSVRNAYLYRLKYEYSNLHEFFISKYPNNGLPILVIDGETKTTKYSYSFYDEDSDQTLIYFPYGATTPIDTAATIAVKLTGQYKVKAVDGVDGAFTLDDDRFSGYITGGTSVSGEFSKETPITSVWISRPVPISKFSYEKTIKQVDVYNDTTEPAELYIGCITNKQLHTYQFAKIEEFDLGDIDWENTTFDKNRVPVIYHMKRFPRRQQYFSLVQMSDSLDNSLLSGMDITFTLNGIARNKK